MDRQPTVRVSRHLRFRHSGQTGCPTAVAAREDVVDQTRFDRLTRHLGRTAPAVPFPTAAAPIQTPNSTTAPESARDTTAAAWAVDAERELKKIPFFVRGKARRNTERFALERGLPLITVETLYDAKSHFNR